MCNHANKSVRSLKVAPGYDPGALEAQPISNEEREARIKAARNKRRRRRRVGKNGGAGPISELAKSAQTHALHESHL